MEELKIAVRLSRKLALAMGISRAGVELHPLVGVYPLLDEATRQWMAEHHEERISNGRCVGINLACMSREYRTEYSEVEVDGPATDARVATGILLQRERYMAAMAKQEREREAKIQQALDAPDVDWIYPSTSGEYYVQQDPYRQVRQPTVSSNGPSGMYLDPALMKDPRIVERIRRVKKEVLPIAMGEWVAACAAWKQAEEEKEARKAAEKEAEQAEHERLRLYVWGHLGDDERISSNICRAAEEGFDVYPQMKSVVASSIEKSIELAIGSQCGFLVECYQTRENLSVPSETSYAIRDAIAAAKETIAEAAILPGASVELRFMRIDVNEHHRAIWRFAVEVHVEVPMLGSYDFYVQTEPEPDDNEDE